MGMRLTRENEHADAAFGDYADAYTITKKEA